MAIFDDWKSHDVASLIDPPTAYETIRLFIEEQDHYQKGEGFIGPIPDVGAGSTTEANDLATQFVNKGIEKAFTSEGVLNEIVHRRVDGVLSKTPGWDIVPRRFHGVDATTPVKAEEQQRIDEQKRALRTWMSAQNVYDTLHQLAVGVTCYQRSVLRLYVPPDRLIGGSLRLDAATPAEALKHIFVLCEKPDAAVVHRHRRSMYEIGVVHSTVERKDERGSAHSEDVYELSYLTDEMGEVDETDGQTFPLTRLKRLEKTADPQTIDLDLRGRLAHYEARERRRYVSAQMIEAQRALNTASTELRIVNDQQGFPIRLIMNGLAPGSLTQDKETGEFKFTPNDNFEFRPSSISFVQGVEIEDEQRNVSDIKSPSATQFDPGDASQHRLEMDRRRRSILNEGKQLFVEIMDDATSSGDARVQAMFDFFLDIAYLKRALDAAGSWMLETAWALACHLAGAVGRDHDLRSDFACKLNVPYLPSALVDSFLKLVEAGARSLDTLMRDTGIDDVTAERRRIEASESFRMKRLQDLFVLGKAMTDFGLSITATVSYLADQFEFVDKTELETLLRNDDALPEDPTTPIPPRTNGLLVDDDGNEPVAEPTA